MPVKCSAQLDKRITLAHPILTDGAAGTGFKKLAYPSAYATVWAKAQTDSSGTLVLEAGADQPKASWRITIRRRSDVAPKDRVVYGPRTLYVVDAGDGHSREEFQDLVCSEEPPQ